MRTRQSADEIIHHLSLCRFLPMEAVFIICDAVIMFNRGYVKLDTHIQLGFTVHTVESLFKDFDIEIYDEFSENICKQILKQVENEYK